MRDRAASLGAVLLWVFAFSYVFNFVWESLHAAFLYERHASFMAVKYVRMVVYVSAIDGALIVGIYFMVMLLWRDMLWICSMGGKHLSAVFIAGLAIAFLIEYRKVFLLGAWSYTPLMPTLFGIGLSPLLQLSVTGAAAFWLTRRMLCRR
ncbi:MAG: hypothetical protein AB1805_06545 [Nitrospirota bacterium]